MLRRSPGFTAAAVLTLALGIGATTAVFSVVNAVILRPLQFPESGRVMTILSSYPEGAYKTMEYMYVEWRDRQRCFDLFAGALTSTRTERVAGDWREIAMAQVSSDFLPMIGTRPPLGRLFSREEDQAGHDSVALLDDGFWRREFGGDPKALGQTIGRYTIIGVLPPGTRFPGLGPRDVWVPLAARPSLGAAGRGGVLAIGRLRPGVTREGAQAEMDAVTRRNALERTQYRTRPAVVKPLREWLVEEVRGTLLTLFGAAAFLLLIACANLANLMLARGTGRTREMAVRAALGAGRKRLAAQMLTESVLLAAMGGAIGAALAVAAVRAAPAIRAIEVPRAEEIAVDRGFLLIALVVSLGSGVLFGLAPAVQAWRRDLALSLHRGQPPSARLGGRRLRDALVAAQLALAMILLSGAGLMSNTLLRLLHVDLGIARSNVFTIRPQQPPARSITVGNSYELVPDWHAVREQDRARGAAFMRDLVERVRRIPGIESASVGSVAPLSAGAGGYNLSYENAGVRRKCELDGRDVDPGYFRAAGIPLLAGHDFEPGDAQRTPLPVILNKAAARQLFGAEDPLGKLVASTHPRTAMLVIGLVGEVHMGGVAKAPGPEAFAPLMGGWGYASLVIARAAVNPTALAPAIRGAVHSLYPDSRPPEITALDDVFSEQVAKPRFYTALLGTFAAIGLILAAVGIYGVTAYSVARRRHEFGVRLALGAEPAAIVRLAIGSGARVVAAGTVAGLAGAWAVTRLLASLLYQVKPRDPLTFVAAAAALAGTAITACWLAARRAGAVDPNVALRCE